MIYNRILDQGKSTERPQKVITSNLIKYVLPRHPKQIYKS
jgi:hypothetical protein